MDFLHRLLDRLDLLIAGLFGVIVASWWHKDDLTDWRAWMIFLITGVSCSLYLTGMVSAYDHRLLVEYVPQYLPWSSVPFDDGRCIPAAAISQGNIRLAGSSSVASATTPR